MIASSAGRNRSFWRSSRGLATASPNADDPPPHRTIRPKRESQSQEIRPCSCHFLRNRLLRSPRLARHLNGPAILHGRLYNVLTSPRLPLAPPARHRLPYQKLKVRGKMPTLYDKSNTRPCL